MFLQIKTEDRNFRSLEEYLNNETTEEEFEKDCVCGKSKPTVSKDNFFILPEQKFLLVKMNVGFRHADGGYYLYNRNIQLPDTVKTLGKLYKD